MSTIGVVIVVAITLAIFLTVYVFGSFSYKISHDYLRMRWRVLIYVPFRFYRIKLDSIEEVRRFDFRKDFLRGGYIFGNLIRKKGLIIVLKKRSLFRKRIFVTPENPDKFIEQIYDTMRRATSD